jgi:hypothetical protein
MRASSMTGAPDKGALTIKEISLEKEVRKHGKEHLAGKADGAFRGSKASKITGERPVEAGGCQNCLRKHEQDECAYAHYEAVRNDGRYGESFNGPFRGKPADRQDNRQFDQYGDIRPDENISAK